jgi:16S rRNA (guanine527-N7)-methyltransferase
LAETAATQASILTNEALRERHPAEYIGSTYPQIGPVVRNWWITRLSAAGHLGSLAVLLLAAAEYGNRAWVRTDAKAGCPSTLAREDRKAPPEHFSLSDTSLTDAAAARRALDDLLVDAPALQARVPDAAFDALELYVALLLDANERLNLTRVVAAPDVAQLHLLDALAALPQLDASAASRVVDLGSGGGVPALPLAIARPDVAWTLVESVGKKAAALRSFVAELGLRNVDVVAERAELLGRDPAYRERFTAATARACAALPVLAELALPLVAVGGELLAWKGPLEAGSPEVVAGADAARLLGGGQPRIVESGVTALGGHRFVVVPKVRPTPSRYPRRPGDPSRHPLGT